MRDIRAFQAKVEEYLRQVYRSEDGRRYTFRDVALEMGLAASTLSHKFTEDRGRLADADVRRIVTVLAGWGAIKSKTQAMELLDLADCPPFSPGDWAAPPLSALRGNVPESAPVPPPTTPDPPPSPQNMVSATRDLTLPAAHRLRLLEKPAVRQIFQHRGFIGDICWSPDGRYLAVAAAPGFLANLKQLPRKLYGSFDIGALEEGPIFILEAATGAVVRRLAAHRGWCYTIAWSPSGRWLASGGEDQLCKVWDVRDLAAEAAEIPPPVELAGHADIVVGLAWSPDEQLLCSTSSDKTAITWRLTGGSATMQSRLAVSYRAQATNPVWLSDPVQIARVTPDSASPYLLVVGGADNIISLWQPRDGRLLQSFPSPVEAVGAQLRVPTPPMLPDSGWLYSLSLSPRQNALAGRDERDAFSVWDIASGQRVQHISTAKKPLARLAWSPDPRYIATCGDDPMVRIWHVETGAEAAAVRVLNSVEGVLHSIRALCWSPDGRSLAVADTLGHVSRIDIAEEG